jgi:hypothetical protein
MAHTIGSLPARASGTSNPFVLTQATLNGETVMVVMLKAAGATDRAGGAPTYAGRTLVQASTTQKAASSPEAGCEFWYLLQPPSGVHNLIIPNTGALTIYYQIGYGRANNGWLSLFDGASGANATGTNPSPGAITTTAAGDIIFAVCAGGWQDFTTGSTAFTQISENDDGAHGGGSHYNLQVSAGSITMSWTHGTSEDYGAVAAAFKEEPAIALNSHLAATAPNGMSVASIG